MIVCFNPGGWAGSVCSAALMEAVSAHTSAGAQAIITSSAGDRSREESHGDAKREVKSRRMNIIAALSEHG